MLLCKPANAHSIYLDFSSSLSEAFLNHIHVDLENFDSLFSVKLSIQETDMDTRREGLIKVANTISG